jgi:signal transduction histidine kinase
MTRKIIEYFGGRIWLDTGYTEGSRFLFTLPMPAEAMDPLPEDENPEDETPKEADD